MKNDRFGRLFRAARKLVQLFYPRYIVQIPEKAENVVYISHHQNFTGPFLILLWFPTFIHTWILSVFLEQSACYRHYVQFTFTERLGWNKTVAKLIALPLSFAITSLFKSGKMIPVYRGSKKIVHTFEQSVEALEKGRSIVIFPDIAYTDRSPQMKEMYEGFLYLEKYFYKKTGKHICFIPVYVSKKKRLIIAKEQIYFRERAEFKSERKVVQQKIRDSLHQLAKQCGDV